MLRHVTASYPNHVWGVDITHVRLQAGWLYLVAIIDWFSRFVVACEVGPTLELPLVLSTVDRALFPAVLMIWNSDQGNQRANQHGLPRTSGGQYFHRALVVLRQVRGGVSQRIMCCPVKPGWVSHVTSSSNTSNIQIRRLTTRHRWRSLLQKIMLL